MSQIVSFYPQFFRLFNTEIIFSVYDIEYDVYLQGGSKPNEGNVMIKKSDYLGPICDDDWTPKQVFSFQKGCNV